MPSLVFVLGVNGEEKKVCKMEPKKKDVMGERNEVYAKRYGRLVSNPYDIPYATTTDFISLYMYVKLVVVYININARVKSAGWLNSIAHFPFFHSWKLGIGPCVVSAAKSGTILPKRILPSVLPSGYSDIYNFVPVSSPSIVDERDRRWVPLFTVVLIGWAVINVDKEGWKLDEAAVVTFVVVATQVEFRRTRKLLAERR